MDIVVGKSYMVAGYDNPVFVVGLNCYYASQKYVHYTRAHYTQIRKNYNFIIRISCYFIEYEIEKNEIILISRKDLVATKFLELVDIQHDDMWKVMKEETTSWNNWCWYVFFY
jgi:hypothetical protein